MRRASVGVVTIVALLAALVGTKTRPDPVSVRPGELVRTYQMTPGNARQSWGGQLIRVHLPAKSYTVFPWGVGFLSGLPNTDPVIRFVMEQPPAGNEKSVTVVGTCHGRVDDGVRKGAGVNFYVQVDDCRIVPE